MEYERRLWQDENRSQDCCTELCPGKASHGLFVECESQDRQVVSELDRYTDSPIKGTAHDVR